MKTFLRFSAFLAILCLSVRMLAFDDEQMPSFNGYVTSFASNQNFSVNGHPVSTTETTTFMRPQIDESNRSQLTRPLLRTGVRVAVYGKADKRSGVFKARKVEVLDQQIEGEIHGRGIEDRSPELTEQNGHLEGTIFVDGYALAVTPQTVISPPPKDEFLHAFDPHIQIAYEAKVGEDWQLLASRIQIYGLDLSDKEHRFQQSSDFRITNPDYAQKEYGKVQFGLHSIRILPDLELQKRVAAIGDSLVPAWQKNLPDSDPAKISFHFIVLEANSSYRTTLSDEAGTVLVPANVLAKLDNDAQLAGLLSADVASVLERSNYQSLDTKHAEEVLSAALLSTPIGLAAGEIGTAALFSSKYWKPLVEQTYRVGLRYLIDAGWDPRQTPEALLRLSVKHPEENHKDPLKQDPEFVSYLYGVLARDYAGMDFSGLKTGEENYRTTLAMLRSADPKAAKKMPVSAGN